MEIRHNSNPAISMLLVEDEVITLKLLTTILAKKYPDISLFTAINGRTGLDLFNTHTAAIVITDINMPEMDGAQLARKIHALKPDTRFIALTGNSRKPILQDSEGKTFEFFHLIVKPVDFKELFATIDRCLDEITS